jgi:hypothetical protein
MAFADFLGAASLTETVPASSAARIHASLSLRGAKLDARGWAARGVDGADESLVNIRDIGIFYPF